MRHMNANGRVWTSRLNLGEVAVNLGEVDRVRSSSTWVTSTG